jgi:hypothetical protein
MIVTNVTYEKRNCYNHYYGEYCTYKMQFILIHIYIAKFLHVY